MSDDKKPPIVSARDYHARGAAVDHTGFAQWLPDRPWFGELGGKLPESPPPDWATLHKARIAAAFREPIARPPEPHYERPAVERYLRADYDLPDGGVIDLGLESRDADTADATAVLGRALDRCVEQACDRIGDAREIAARLHALCEAWFPDRYWFAEVWTPSGAIKRYQVIQPAVVGGFRR